MGRQTIAFQTHYTQLLWIEQAKSDFAESQADTDGCGEHEGGDCPGSSASHDGLWARTFPLIEKDESRSLGGPLRHNIVAVHGCNRAPQCDQNPEVGVVEQRQERPIDQAGENASDDSVGVGTEL